MQVGTKVEEGWGKGGAVRGNCVCVCVCVYRRNIHLSVRLNLGMLSNSHMRKRTFKTNGQPQTLPSFIRAHVQEPER